MTINDIEYDVELTMSCNLTTEICPYCFKYKRLQGNGIMHQLCECGNYKLEKFVGKFKIVNKYKNL